MARWFRGRSGVVAVGSAVALHALLGLGLWCASNGAAPLRSHTARPSGGSNAADELLECETYLIPDARPGAKRIAIPDTPALSPEETFPTLRLTAMGPGMLGSDEPATVPPPKSVQANKQGSFGSKPGTGVGGLAPTFFGLPVAAQKLVYVLDRSSSMGENSLLTRASRELLNSLEQLPAAAQFQILVYNRITEPLWRTQPEWRTASVEQRQAVALALTELRAEGGTDHLPALRRAVGLRPDVIFFVTDADDLTEEQVRLATDLNVGKAVIHTVELNLTNRLRTFMPLQELARRNGGRYQAVDLSLMPPLPELAPRAN